MKTIEEKLWDFIDGTSSADEKLQVEQLLNADPAVKQLYDQFLSISARLRAIEVEEPSMRFTQNVMDRIRLEPFPKPLSTRIDQRVIRAIAGFFIGAILLLVGYTLSRVSWNAGNERWNFQFPALDWSKYFGSAFTEGCMVAFVIFVFFAIDRYLGYARRMHKAH